MPLSREDLGRRIARARDRAGQSQSQLSATVGLSQSAISRVESGERGVDSLELAAIAEALDASVVDLLDSRPLAQELRLAARTRAVNDVGALDRAVDRIVDLIRLDDLLRERELGVVDGPQPPPLDRPTRGRAIDQGRQLAERVRDAWGLDDDPLPDLFNLIEDRAGVFVVLEPLDGGLDGLCARTDGLAVVLVDSSPVLGRQRFTASHELGHWLFGDGDTLIVDERLFGQSAETEMRANAFAANFLMPERGLRRYLRDRSVDGNVATELQYQFGVSLDSLLWHLLNLDVVDEDTRASLANVGAKSLAYRHGYASEWERFEGERNARRPPHTLFARALDAYAQGWIGIEPVADLLGRRDVEALRSELESHGIAHDARWWEATAPA